MGKLMTEKKKRKVFRRKDLVVQPALKRLSTSFDKIPYLGRFKWRIIHCREPITPSSCYWTLTNDFRWYLRSFRNLSTEGSFPSQILNRLILSFFPFLSAIINLAKLFFPTFVYKWFVSRGLYVVKRDALLLIVSNNIIILFLWI